MCYFAFGLKEGVGWRTEEKTAARGPWRGRRGGPQRTRPRGLTPASPVAVGTSSGPVWVCLQRGRGRGRSPSQRGNCSPLTPPFSEAGNGSTIYTRWNPLDGKAAPTGEEGVPAAPWQGSSTHQQPHRKAQNWVSASERCAPRGGPAVRHPCPHRRAWRLWGGRWGRASCQAHCPVSCQPPRPSSLPDWTVLPSPPPSWDKHDRG